MDATPKILINYETVDGKQPFREWIQKVRDKVAVARIRSRLDRVEQGNFGDVRPAGRGVQELRFTFGSGFRIYFGEDGDTLVILLVGGDKSSQEKDIKLAHEYWADYKGRTHNGKNR